MGSSLPTINVGDFVGNHVGDIKGGKKRFGGDAKSGYSKDEDKGNVGVCCLLAKLAFR